MIRRLLDVLDRGAVIDSATLFLPAIPFGFVVGLEITESALPLGLGVASSPIVFAGAAQLAVLTLAGTASIWAVIVAGLVINTRHAMYSAAIAPSFRAQPRWMRWVGAYFLLDQVFALATLQSERSPDEYRRYYLTSGLFFWISWHAAVALGMVFGPAVPESWRLEFAAPIMFVGLALIGVQRTAQGVAAMVGGLVALATAGLPDRLGILVGAVAGVIAGAITEQVTGQTTGTGAERGAT